MLESTNVSKLSNGLQQHLKDCVIKTLQFHSPLNNWVT
uniref:Uncharacterized protein n=1 Tax=Rhizophora mucronata TaxID=61149 RepID=A0A2P2P173_RHIMU